MMKQMRERGFTLIELLVVIAIIGILAAVVLASLNDARDGGQDAAIRQTSAGIRSQAEIFYNRAGAFTYDAVCADPNIVLSLNGLNANRAETVDVVSVDGTASDGDSVTCHDAPGGYAVVAPLNIDAAGAGNEAWCIDSNGFAGAVAVNALAANEIRCN